MCEDCELTFPLLADIPILVDEPNSWLVAHREALLVSLAEFNLLDSVDVAQLLSIKTDGHIDTRFFSDDWTEHEFNRSSRPESQVQIESWQRFINDCDSKSSVSVVERILKEKLIGDTRSRVGVEIGPGAGGLTEEKIKVSGLFIGED